MPVGFYVVDTETTVPVVDCDLIGAAYISFVLLNLLYFTIFVKFFKDVLEDDSVILFLYGAGDAAMEVYDMVMRNVSIKRRYSKVVFIDDFAEEAEFYGSMRIKFSSVESFRKGEDAEFAITLGEPSNRKILREKVTSAGYRLATLVADSVIVSPSAEIGEGCIVFDGTVISSKSRLSTNCYVIFRVIIGHGAVVGEDSTIAPTAIVGGNCVVGEQTFIGMRSSIMQGIKMGSKAIIGMGAIVFRDVEPGATMLGNPARASKGKDEHKVF